MGILWTHHTLHFSKQSDDTFTDLFVNILELLGGETPGLRHDEGGHGEGEEAHAAAHEEGAADAAGGEQRGEALDRDEERGGAEDGGHGGGRAPHPRGEQLGVEDPGHGAEASRVAETYCGEQT